MERLYVGCALAASGEAKLELSRKLKSLSFFPIGSIERLLTIDVILAESRVLPADQDSLPRSYIDISDSIATVRGLVHLLFPPCDGHFLVGRAEGDLHMHPKLDISRLLPP